MFKVGDKVRYKDEPYRSDFGVVHVVEIYQNGTCLVDTGTDRYGNCTEWNTSLELVEEHPSASSGAMREKLDTVPYDLVPFQEMTDAYSRVAEYGAKKYASWNWSKGLPRVQIIGSLLRHTWAYLRGEECDKETGLSHTDHILWNAVTLSHNVRWNLEDGRRVEPDREYKNNPTD